MYLEHNNKTYYCTTGDVEKPYLQYDKYKIPMTYSSSSVPSSFTDYPNQSTFGYGNYRNKVEASTSSSTSYGYSGISSRQSTSGYSGWSTSTASTYHYESVPVVSSVSFERTITGSNNYWLIHLLVKDKYYDYITWVRPNGDTIVTSHFSMWSYAGYETNLTAKFGTKEIKSYVNGQFAYRTINLNFNWVYNWKLFDPSNETDEIRWTEASFVTSTCRAMYYTTTDQYGILNDQTALTRQSDFYTTSVEKGIMSNTTLLSTSNSTTSLY